MDIPGLNMIKMYTRFSGGNVDMAMSAANPDAAVKPDAAQADYVLGQVLKATVVEIQSGGQAVIDINGQRVLAESERSLSPGQNLTLKVTSLTPQVAMTVLAGEDQTKEATLSLLRSNLSAKAPLGDLFQQLEKVIADILGPGQGINGQAVSQELDSMFGRLVQGLQNDNPKLLQEIMKDLPPDAANQLNQLLGNTDAVSEGAAAGPARNASALAARLVKANPDLAPEVFTKLAATDKSMLTALLSELKTNNPEYLSSVLTGLAKSNAGLLNTLSGVDSDIAALVQGGGQTAAQIGQDASARDMLSNMEALLSQVNDLPGGNNKTLVLYKSISDALMKNLNPDTESGLQQLLSNALKDDLTTLSDRVVSPDKGAVSSATAQKLLDLIGSLTVDVEGQSVDFFKNFVENSGISYESKLARYVETDGKGQPPPHELSQKDLKGLLMSVQKELTAGDKKGPGGSQPQVLDSDRSDVITKLAQAVKQGIQNIELNQVTNVVSGKNEQQFTFQIPFSLPEGLRTADLMIRFRSNKEKGKKQSDPNRIYMVFFLNLKGLGDLRVDARMEQRQIGIQFSVARDDVNDFVKTALPELKERLQALDFGVVDLSSRVAPKGQVPRPDMPKAFAERSFNVINVQA
ncbi:MAG: flagellar hook-length control protein FliK [Deltaproteobacteria bacterium]|nr:flagellar hook-length control protein FliK [Deltaproteobacteria bacterium]